MSYSEEDEPIPGLFIGKPNKDAEASITIDKPSLPFSLRWNRIVEHPHHIEILSYFTNREGHPMTGQVEIYSLKNGKTVSKGYVVDNSSESVGSCMLVASGLEEPAEVLI